MYADQPPEGVLVGLLTRLSEAVTGTGTPSLGSDVTGLSGELAATAAELSMLKESFADLERLYTDDIGWARLGMEDQSLSSEGRRRIAKLADLTVTANPLMKKGVGLRIGYVWGDGVTVTIRDDGSTGQDVNGVWREFWDEPSNRREFTSSEAQVRYERKLATGGEAFWALPTDKATGRVWIRRIPPREIVDRITDPEDSAKVWFYKRVWTAVTYDKTSGKRGTQNRTTYYPALGFYPAQRPTRYDGDPIRWDAPMRPVTVNCPDEDWRGLGDVLAAMPWARMDKEFLEDLAVYMRALTRILGQVTGKNSKTAKAAAAALRAATAATNAPGAAPGQGAGSWAATDPGTSMEIVSKSGAHIDAESHRPLATYVAAGLEVPLTMLLGDPGISGARAVAETLDQPTENMARTRRSVHEELFRDVAGYVIDQAVIAGAGPLRGSVRKDGDRLLVELPEGDDRIVDVGWPEFDSTPLNIFVESVAAAEELPPLEKFKLYAKAFKLEDLDDLIDALTDADGNWTGPGSDTAAQVAVDRFRAGQDPAEVA